MNDNDAQPLREEVRRLRLELEATRAENALLRQELDRLAGRIYGKKSEQLSADQLQLLFQELVAPGPALGKPCGPEGSEAHPPRPLQAPERSRKQRKSRIPEHLTVIEEIVDPEPVKACPEAWRQIGEEITERLEYEPARIICRRTVRRKYVRRGAMDTVPLIAALPPCILERSIATPSLVAQILVAKYCEHLPLYRQEYIFRSRYGVPLSRQSMAEWVGVAADWLRLIYEALGSEVMEGGYVQCDETPVRYLAPGNGKTKTGYLWACKRPGADVVFWWKTSRAASCLENIVPVHCSGVIQCDGYTAYYAFQRSRPAGEIVLAGCWAHVRRKFFDALDHAPREAGLVLHLLQNLYRTEAKLRKTRAGPKLRAIRRSYESQPVIERLLRTLQHWKARRRFLPRSLMGKAIDYALGQWDSLLLFLDDGRLEVDNNLIENAIRPTAIGKKNWLFIGEANAGHRSAMIYTLIEACRRRNIDPYEYLRDVLSQLPSATTTEIKALTPQAWAQSRRGASLRSAA